VVYQSNPVKAPGAVAEQSRTSLFRPSSAEHGSKQRMNPCSLTAANKPMEELLKEVTKIRTQPLPWELR
jgi:hypothetical protein